MRLNVLGKAAKTGVFLLILMLSGFGRTSDLGNDDQAISMASLAVTKKIGAYTAYTGARLYQAIDGELASLDMVGKVSNQLYWDVGYFGLFTKTSTGDVIHNNRSRAKFTNIKSFDVWRL
jgi:hypothetical protein